VLDELALDEEARARVRSPAGLDLGPSSQEEIAVAILAELVAWRNTRSQDVLVEYATDPVCGMSVAVAGAQHTLEHAGTTYYFCGAHCLRKFESALV
jgi:YHS domain-containing protein